MIDPATLILSLALAAQNTPSDVVQTAETAQADEQSDDSEKVICRRTAVIGSKFKKKICGTKKQWETLENRSEETTRTWQRRGKGLEPNDSNRPGT